MLSPTFFFFPQPQFVSNKTNHSHKQKTHTSYKYIHAAHSHSYSHFSSQLHSQSHQVSIFSENREQTYVSCCTNNSTLPNTYLEPTFIASQLQSCSTLKQLRYIHAVIIRTFVISATFLYNNLISAYVGFGELIHARKVFDKMSKRNVVSWTAVLNGYITFGLDNQAYMLLEDFFISGVRANAKTYVCILNLCTSGGDLELGKQIHACIVKQCCSNLILDSCVVYFYAQCGELEGMFCAFERMKDRDVISWTTVISACSQWQFGEEAFTLFLQMLNDGYTPNEFTICSVLKACGDEQEMGFGRQLHASVVKGICRNDVFIETSLVDMYAK